MRPRGRPDARRRAGADHRWHPASPETSCLDRQPSSPRSAAGNARDAERSSCSVVAQPPYRPRPGLTGRTCSGFPSISASLFLCWYARPTETSVLLAMALTCCLAASRGYRSLLLDDAVHRGSTSMKQVVNDALRRALSRPKPPRATYPHGRVSPALVRSAGPGTRGGEAGRRRGMLMTEKVSHGSADLPYPPIASSPGLAGRPYVSVQPAAERHSQPVGQGETFSPDPFPGRPFGIGDRHGFDLYPIADQKRPGEIPISAMRADLLGDLRPVSGATGTAIAERFLDGCCAVLSLQESEERRCIEDVHAASSVVADMRRSARSSLTRSKPVRSARTSS